MNDQQEKKFLSEEKYRYWSVLDYDDTDEQGEDGTICPLELEQYVIEDDMFEEDKDYE